MTEKTQEDIILLQHILSCIEIVYDRSDGILHTIHEDINAWDATLRRLQIMSESATKISDDTKAKLPNIEWKKIRGFRNILVHDYLGDIDPIVVRLVITEQLPILKKECSNMLKQLKGK